MKYYFNLIKAHNEHEKIHGENCRYQYFTNDEIQNIELYELECSEDEFCNDSKYNDYWCVYDVCGYSNEFMEFETKEEAIDMLKTCLNQTVFECIYDI